MLLIAWTCVQQISYLDKIFLEIKKGGVLVLKPEVKPEPKNLYHPKQRVAVVESFNSWLKTIPLGVVVHTRQLILAILKMLVVRRIDVVI